MVADTDRFDDWVDNLYGFMHLINHPMPTLHSDILLGALVEDVQEADSEDPMPEKRNLTTISSHAQ